MDPVSAWFGTFNAIIAKAFAPSRHPNPQFRYRQALDAGLAYLSGDRSPLTLSRLLPGEVPTLESVFGAGFAGLRPGNLPPYEPGTPLYAVVNTQVYDPLALERSLRADAIENLTRSPITGQFFRLSADGQTLEQLNVRTPEGGWTWGPAPTHPYDMPTQLRFGANPATHDLWWATAAFPPSTPPASPALQPPLEGLGLPLYPSRYTMQLRAQRRRYVPTYLWGRR